MQTHIEYVVGEDKELVDVISEKEVLPLLQGAVSAGVDGAAVLGSDKSVIWSCGTISGSQQSFPLILEGEPVGHVAVYAESATPLVKGIAEILRNAINTVAVNNLKRMLTTESHTTIVNQSYEELLATNKQLVVSEARYRHLAENLEKLVEERTAELKRAHARLLHQEKMASVGALAAGMAHEINNPIGFVASNLNTLNKYVGRFKEIILFCRSAAESCVASRLSEKWKELKMELIWSDVDDLIAQSIGGAERVQSIVADLKAFSHIDDVGKQQADINSEVDRTINVLSHVIPPGTDIVKRYELLPPFTCNPAELCQVFFNIMVNAVQARREGLKMTISTSCRDNIVRTEFWDNGPGIPESERHRVFDPFYTTKDVGAGKGLGLTIAYETITSYGGTIEAICPPEGGTAIVITLPLQRDGS